MSRREDGTLQCDMTEDCTAEVTMIDDKGWVYCANHGWVRKNTGRLCRQLRTYEVNRLRRGEQITRY